MGASTLRNCRKQDNATCAGLHRRRADKQEVGTWLLCDLVGGHHVHWWLCGPMGSPSAQHTRDWGELGLWITSFPRWVRRHVAQYAGPQLQLSPAQTWQQQRHLALCVSCGTARTATTWEACTHISGTVCCSNTIHSVSDAARPCQPRGKLR